MLLAVGEPTPTVTVTETVTATPTVTVTETPPPQLVTVTETAAPTELDEQNAANVERLVQYVIPALAVLAFLAAAVVALLMTRDGDR